MERWAGTWVGYCLLRYDENSCHFNSICSVPGSVLSSFHRVACFILKTALGCSYCYDPHATDGETEAWGERVACLRLQSSRVCALSLYYDLPLNGCLVDFFPSTLYYDTFQTYRKKKICFQYSEHLHQIPRWNSANILVHTYVCFNFLLDGLKVWYRHDSSLLNIKGQHLPFVWYLLPSFSMCSPKHCL